MLVLIDQDGVLADFNQGFEAAWRRAGHAYPVVPSTARRHFRLTDEYPADLRSDVEAIYTAPGFFRDLPPIPGALDAVHALLAQGHQVGICTSPLDAYRHCVTEKYEWVERHLGRAFLSRLILTKDKTLIHGDVLIDDKPTITGLRQPAWQHVIYDQPYNRHVDGPRLDWSNWQATLHAVTGACRTPCDRPPATPHRTHPTTYRAAVARRHQHAKPPRRVGTNCSG